MFKSRLGDFIQTQTDPEGPDLVFYCVPDEERPPHWVAKRRLPATGMRDGCPYTSKLATLIERDIKLFDDQLELYRKRAALSSPGGDRSVAALAELYRIEGRKSRCYADLVPESKARVDYNIKKLERWSDDNGSPSFATIDQVALTELLELYNDRPCQKVQMRVALSHLLETARLCGWRADNPMEQVRVPQPKLPARDFWSDADVALMIAGARELGHPGLAGVIEFLSETGQRYRDVIRMRHGHEYSEGYLSFRQSKRDASIKGKVQTRLVELIKKQQIAGSNFLFNHPGTGTGYTSSQLQYAFGRVRAHVHEGGRTWLTLQTLRHTCVVKLISADVHPYTIASMTGHRYQSIDAIMERYGIRTSDGAMKALMALNRAKGGEDADFGDYAPAEASWEPKAALKQPGQIGSRRKLARQYLKSYLDAQELYRLFDDGSEDGVNLALQLGAKLS